MLATARTVEKARDACAGLKGDFLPLACELSDPASVRACVAAVKSGAAPLDAIVGNAGVMAIPKPEQKFGWELHLFTNHIGHFILITGLLDRLAPAGRVVVVASNAHRRAPAAGIEFDNLSGERGYEPMKAYGASKLANILFTRELARRLGNGTQTANTLHPGVISTGITRTIPALAQMAMKMASPARPQDARPGRRHPVLPRHQPGGRQGHRRLLRRLQPVGDDADRARHGAGGAALAGVRSARRAHLAARQAPADLARAKSSMKRSTSVVQP